MHCPRNMSKRQQIDLGRRFEPSVPLATVSLILAEEKGLQADPARAGTAA